MRGWCRYPRSNSTHEDQISEIDVLVRLNFEDFLDWLGALAKRQQITGQGRPRPAGNSSNTQVVRYESKQAVEERFIVIGNISLLSLINDLLFVTDFQIRN